MSRPSHQDGTELIFSPTESLIAGIIAALCALLGTSNMIKIRMMFFRLSVAPLRSC